MKTILLIILLIFLIVIILPFIFNIEANFYILENYGIIKIKLFGFKVSSAFYKFSQGKIIVRKKNSAKILHIDLQGPEIKFLENFGEQIKDKVKIHNVIFYSHIGTKDAYLSAMLSGIVVIIEHTICAYLKNLKQTMSALVIPRTEYCRKFCDIKINIKFSITLFDFLYATLISSTKVKAFKKEAV